MTDDVERRQLRSELAHWRAAITQLTDLDSVAPPEAWAQLEDYLRLRLRTRLLSSVAALDAEGAVLATRIDSGDPIAATRSALLRLRQRYLAVEVTVEWFGDSVQQRTTPRLGAVLRGLDTIAVDAMEVLLRPLGIEVPPVLTYPDKGLGAAVLKAGINLWDRGGISPVAAIKITRHNLASPLAITHESTHQVAALTGWNPQLAEVLRATVAPTSADLAEQWASWASELAADVGQFVLTGWSSVPALANVVDGTTAQVHRIRPGDPHPPAWLRILFNVELCRTWFGPDGPWTDLAATWRARHDPRELPGADAAVAAASVAVLPQLAAACTRHAFPAFGGRPISALADPRRVSPPALAQLARDAGDSLTTSTFLARNDSLRILALMTSEMSLDPTAAADQARRLHDWLARLAPLPLPRAA